MIPKYDTLKEANERLEGMWMENQKLAREKDQAEHYCFEVDGIVEELRREKEQLQDQLGKALVKTRYALRTTAGVLGHMHSWMEDINPDYQPPDEENQGPCTKTWIWVDQQIIDAAKALE
jgi:hypothetical protein